MPNAEQSFQIQELAQVALTVADLSQARHFYETVLGMRFLFESGGMVFFQCGTVRLMIGTSDKPHGEQGTLLYFRVPDLQSADRYLKAKGTVFVQEPHLVARMKSHDLWLAFIKDPSENTLGLMSEVERDGVRQDDSRS